MIEYDTEQILFFSLDCDGDLAWIAEDCKVSQKPSFSVIRRSIEIGRLFGWSEAKMKELLEQIEIFQVDANHKVEEAARVEEPSSNKKAKEN